MRKNMIELLHKSDFEPYVNETFTVHSQLVGDQDVILAELTEKNYPGQECFSVIFRGPKQPVMQQMTYTLTHPKMGDIEMFMVPVHYPTKQDGIYYQSVFNRLIER
jgi:hypothetical protein